MKNIVYKGFSIFLGIWIILAVASLFYNAQKTFSEEIQWLTLPDTEKRYKIFGDIYPFLEFVKVSTKEDTKILLITKHPMAFYFGMYTLYPRKIAVTDNTKDAPKLLKKSSFDFVVTYNKEFTSEHYSEIATYSGKNTTDFATLYKRK